MDPARAESFFAPVVQEIQDFLDTDGFPAMREAGVTGPMYVNSTYLNPDDSLVWERDFASSD